MKITRVLACILALLMALSLFGCAAEDPTPTTEVNVETNTDATTEPVNATEGNVAEENTGITAGIYQGTFEAEGRGLMVNYFHFYENGIFYYSAYNGGQTMAGYYEGPVDMEIEYTYDNQTYTASQAIILTNFDGSEFATVAYQDDELKGFSKLYNLNLPHVLDSGHKMEDENGIAVAEYVSPDDSYATVSINHNGTFQDMITSLVEGSWTREGNVYTLTDAETGAVSTLTLSEDGASAEYAGSDGTNMTLIVPVPEFSVQFVFNSQDNEALTLELYNDGTCAVIYDGLGTVTDGTWSVDASTQLPTWTIELAQTFEDKPVEVVTDLENMQFSVAFTNSSGQLSTTFILTFADYKAAMA